MTTLNPSTSAKEQLNLAEQQTHKLFDAVEHRGLIVPGKSELELSNEIVKLAQEEFGIHEYWHKHIVRTGPNTLFPYSGNPENRIIQQDDILFLDFGPIFQGWEADVGRTIVLGSDPLKLKLKQDVDDAWDEARDWYAQQTHLTGAEYFDYVTALATKYGWEFGGEIAGHIVGPYPHEQLAAGDMGLDVHPDNHDDILGNDKEGNKRHWILEILFIDRTNNIGGYKEQLL